MQTLQHTYGHTYTPVAEKQSWASQFITWCKGQEEYRFGWMAAIVAIHGCMLTPITVLLVAISGNTLVFWIMAISAMAMALISNLAAMPTKFTIPIFFFSVMIDLAIITISLYNLFNF